VALQVVVLGLCFVVIALVSDSIWAIGAGTAGERLRRSVRFARAERFVSGGALLGLGVVAAVSGDARRS
jgi:threonine/homoserine/homoserine lactone efflux protein